MRRWTRCARRTSALSGSPIIRSPPSTQKCPTVRAARCGSTTSTRAHATARSCSFMHGEPSWSFLYRKMIPGARRRRVACSRPTWSVSDVPTSPLSAATTRTPRHVEWMRAPALRCRPRLDAVTLVGQDWGGLIGLRLVAEHQERFARVVTANTYLPTGDTPPGDEFHAWQRFSQTTPTSRSAPSSTVAAAPTSRTRSSPCTTRRSPTIPTKPASGSSPCSCRRAPTIPPPARTRRVDGVPELHRARGSRRSRTRMRSPPVAIARSSAISRAAQGSPTQRSPVAATFCRRTGGRNLASWRPSSPRPRPS